MTADFCVGGDMRVALSCVIAHQRFFPSITCTGAVAASKLSKSRALTPIRRVVPSQVPSGWKAGLSVKVPQPQVGQKLWAANLEFQW